MRNALAASAQIFIFVALSMKKHFLFIAILFILLGSTVAMAQEKAFGSLTPQCKLITPNAFTPNGDGINDTIRPVFNCMTEVTMSIYDTWGGLLFMETGEDLYGWDGLIDGRPAENGNYIIVIKATTFQGLEVNYNGPITLLK